jgi:hypothetical protein
MKPMRAHIPFASPYHRAEHRVSLDDYCMEAAKGSYWQAALVDRCYVAPTQAFVLPDGSQHWCGAHAIRRPEPLGNARENSLRENIRANMPRWNQYPNEHCSGCAGATCVINQTALRSMRSQVAEWLGELGSASSDSSGGSR